MLLLTIGIWLAFSCDEFAVLGKNYPECYGVEKFNTFVASRKSCARYIFCDGENSFEGECLGDNLFNEKEGNCDDPGYVECPHLNNGNVNIDDGDGNGKGEHNGNSDNEHSGNASGSITNSYNNNNIFNNTINANSGVIISNNGNHHENEESKPIIDLSPSIVLPELLPEPDLNEYPSVFNPLPSTAMPSNEFVTQPQPQCPQSYDQINLIHLPNPTSCDSYYTCYNGMAIPMICGRNMYFNVQSSKCEPKEQVQCTLERPVQFHCLKGIYDFMPHPKNCDYYYFCSNGFLMIFQCPFKFTWHYERRTCVHQSQSKCFPTTRMQRMLFA